MAHTVHFQWGRKPQKICPSPWDCVTPPEEDRATAIGNMHKNLVKIARVVREIYHARGQTDRQTDTHTHTCSVQYFATPAAGKVIISSRQLP